jgi:aminopeptidase
MNAADRKRLATQFMRNAVKVSPGDNVWIEFQGPKAEILAEACKAEVVAAGAIPHMKSRGAEAVNAEIANMNEAQIAARGEKLHQEMKTMQAYIRIRDDYDQAKLQIPEALKTAYKQSLHEMTQHRVKNTRWLVTEAPTEEFAKACGMTLPEFEDFYRDVCLVDYGLMGEAVKPLQKIMTEGKKVHIVSPAQETDLTFSIEGIPAVPCTGT